MSISPPPIYGGIGPDSLVGGIDNDNIYGGAGSDLLYGGDGNDNLRGGDGADHLYGGLGNDMLNGDTGSDIMEGGLGDDVYVVDAAGDQVIEAGGEGYDSVKSYVSYALTDNVERLDLQGSTNIDATGNGLDNTLKGNFGNNVLMGLDGADSISASDGQDTLIGGAGHDWLQGGNGADRFVLGGWSDYIIVGGKAVSTSSDAIVDFVSGEDKIVVNKLDYEGFSQGALGSDYFTVGTSANIYHAQFVYDQAHKALYFDSDGLGAAKMVKVADIPNAAAIVASDISIFSAPPVQPLLLTFTDLNSQALGGVVPADYHGFSFTTGNNLPNNTTTYSYPSPINVLDGTAYFDHSSGYYTAGGMVALNQYQGTDLHRTDGSDFIFKGMDVTAAWGSGQEITLHGYLDGYEVFTESFHASRTSVTHFASDWLIDDLQIETHMTDGSINQQTVFDNIATVVSIFP
ncbi:MAG: hypothetical protein JWP35_4703 [Caulobacter sp.]|nr:hypothetical protein [Caulobacter sp.]